MTSGILRGLARAAIAGLALFALAPAQAGQFGLGITLNATGWEGDNGPGTWPIPHPPCERPVRLVGR